MTDLDRKIAEFKGWVFRPERAIIVSPDGKQTIGILAAMLAGQTIDGLNWSTDTAKAFELVDEVGLPFMLTKNHPINKDGDCLNGCYMSFWVDGVWLGQGTHPTVPEAICRAYIEAKKWLKENGKV